MSVELIHPFIAYGFMRRALAACAALSVGGAPLGVFLVQRRMALVGDAISHAILPGAAVAFLCSGLSLLPMTLGGLAAGLLVAFAAGALTRVTPLKEDASFTGAYLLSLAAGVMIISLRGNTIDLMHVLFGNVLAVEDTSLMLMASIASLSTLVLAAMYRGLIVECCDAGFMKSVGGKGGLIHQVFLALVVLNLVAAFQALGTLMALGLMVLPAIASRFWTEDIDAAIIFSILAALASAVAGLLISYHSSLPSGPAIVLAAGVLYIASVGFGRHGSLTAQYLKHRHYRET